MLDFDMFPHIRDSIVQYACPKSLMALRGASHDLRRLCDERLFDHVEIEITFDGVVLVHPFGTGLAFEWMRLDVFINSVPLQDIPAAYRKAYSDPESRAPERKLLRQYIQSRMEIARVVDLRREHEQPLLRCRKYVKPPLVLALSELKANVRYFHPYGGLETLEPQDYTHLRLCLPGRLARPIQSPQDMQVLSDLLMRVLPRGACFNTARRITVHLLDPHGAGRPGTGGLWVRKPAADIGINTPTQPQGDQISRRWPIQLTVVGGIEQLRLAFGLSPAPPAKLCAELGVAAQVVRPHDMGFAYEAPPPYLRFLTPEAYVEEVGAEQFALETQLDPYEGPAAMYVP
ncbi:uncharacterized protein CcaverHIS019_0701310 [Cutaneotrichosporon cavernicola]|uniref:Uncharacterized protein n=1 Tax=Cutaneotrichosporon cavernicola TaxID=279322 RepID=A0AA48QYD5_9TREE|nr:uncharacterized protein CcaverHIS019_0701310 [Cutaneotrichosporon cavernicola]BEI94559.1 hypothetical protein CcaverHIS019_0701310 [Cutaneotrichosporon cavernicola]BEJ02335.1 hypothetical protein CcaverHIS631_0701300 [Cutaneotrichosporon cavernicola]BEJ10094.1 hypothetical protein CcaverHIS641_0701290 [Cutaneotrichosporon cavernicola]